MNEPPGRLIRELDNVAAALLKTAQQVKEVGDAELRQEMPARQKACIGGRQLWLRRSTIAGEH